MSCKRKKGNPNGEDAGIAGLTKPPAPPPRSTPLYAPCLSGTGAELIRYYIGYYVYVWTKSGSSFWMYTTEYTSDTVGGYIWNGFGWKYTSFPPDSIDSVQ